MPKGLRPRLPPPATAARESQETLMSWQHARWYGAGFVAVGLGVGSAFGAVTNDPCDDKHWLFCGPGWGAAFGGVTGSLAASAIGSVAAIVSEKYRRPGLVAASIGGVTVVATLIVGAVRKNKAST